MKIIWFLNVLVESNFAGSLSCFIVGVFLSNFNLNSFLIHQTSYLKGYLWYLIHQEVLGSIWKIGSFFSFGVRRKETGLSPNLPNQVSACSFLRTPNQGSALSFLWTPNLRGTGLSPNSKPAKPGLYPVLSLTMNPLNQG